MATRATALSAGYEISSEISSAIISYKYRHDESELTSAHAILRMASTGVSSSKNKERTVTSSSLRALTSP